MTTIDGLTRTAEQSTESIVVTSPIDPPGATFTAAEQRVFETSESRVVDGYDLDSYPDALAFVARSSISLFAAPTSGLTAAGTFVLIATASHR